MFCCPHPAEFFFLISSLFSFFRGCVARLPPRTSVNHKCNMVPPTSSSTHPSFGLFVSFPLPCRTSLSHLYLFFYFISFFSIYHSLLLFLHFFRSFRPFTHFSSHSLSAYSLPFLSTFLSYTPFAFSSPICSFSPSPHPLSLPPSAYHTISPFTSTHPSVTHASTFSDTLHLHLTLTYHSKNYFLSLPALTHTHSSTHLRLIHSPIS